MAKKNSFIVHLDSLVVLDELGDTDNEKYINAGKLLFAIRDYHIGNTLNLDAVTRIAFVPFKNQFDRDQEKYDKMVERNRQNAQKKSNKKPKDEPKKEEQPQQPEKPKEPVKKPKKAEIPTYEEFMEYALEKAPNLNKWKTKLKYDSWVENGWKDGNHKPIKNWKTKLLNTLEYLIDGKQATNTGGAKPAAGKTAGTYSRSQAVNSAQAIPRKDN